MNGSRLAAAVSLSGVLVAQDVLGQVDAPIPVERANERKPIATVVARGTAATGGGFGAGGAVDVRIFDRFYAGAQMGYVLADEYGYLMAAARASYRLIDDGVVIAPYLGVGHVGVGRLSTETYEIDNSLAISPLVGLRFGAVVGSFYAGLETEIMPTRIEESSTWTGDSVGGRWLVPVMFSLALGVQF